MHSDGTARRRGRFVRIPRAGVLLALATLAVVAIGACSASAATAGPVFDGRAPMPAATAASKPVSELSGGAVDKGNAADPGTESQAITPDRTYIVKTGSMSIEVTNIDSATAQAQAAIEGMGGYVAGSNRYGSGEDASATISFRLPVTRWDDALKAMRALGVKMISEQTGTSDVTSQVVDLDARLTNLKATETALLGIMTKATEIKDILAVQDQLTQVRGQIEQLTAQRDHLKDQAVMSTLSVAFVLPNKTVTTQATSDWDLNKQVDEAVAALVRIGQGMATVAVWAVIVGLPLLVGLLILWILYRIGRRITRRPTQGAA